MTIGRSFAVSLLLLLLLLFLRDGECAAPRVTFSKAKSCASFHESVENKEESKAKIRKIKRRRGHRFTLHQEVFTHANK